MTDTTFDDTRAPLGVGRIVGDTFSILFRKLPAILILGFIPALVQLLIVTVLPGQIASQLAFDGTVEFDGSSYAMAVLVVFLLSMLTSSIVTAMIVQLSYDAKLDRPSRIGRYFASAIGNLPAVFLLSILSTILFILGWVAFLVPGLWLMSVFSVFVPAIVIEGAGFRALGRSARLTKNYRWPIVGTMVLIFLCIAVFSAVLGAVVGLVTGSFFGGPTIVQMILEAIGNGLTYGMFSIAVALVFARLKEIKEGVGVADLVEVFR